MKLLKSEKACKTFVFWAFQVAMIAFYCFKTITKYYAFRYLSLMVAIPIVLDIIASVLINVFVNKNWEQTKNAEKNKSVKYLLFGIALFVLALISGITIGDSDVCWVLTFVIAFIALNFSLYGLLFCKEKDDEADKADSQNK
jgi:putative Mn2+ efflux pump MntP